MKAFFSPLTPGLVLLLALAGCDKKEAKPVDYEQEIQRRVEEKLAQERLALQQKELDQKAQELEQKEKDLAARQAQLAQDQAQPSASRGSVSTGDAGEQDQLEEQAASYGPFYDALSSLGNWFEVPRYGYVWQPAGVANNPRWRPYTLGRWAYSDQGWTWISNEPFGWATYHYGRWTRLRTLGWVWVPGDQWAPAWVAWRNSDNYIGWAPLPPESSASSVINEQADDEYGIDASFYTFVPLVNFGDMELNQGIIAYEQNDAIIHETWNVTNIYVNRTEVINYGPSINIFVKRTHRPIEHLRIERKADIGSDGIHGGVLAIRAPVIERHRGTHQVPKISRKISEAEVERTPAGTPRTGVVVNAGRIQPDRSAAREPSRAIATPPPLQRPGGQPAQQGRESAPSTPVSSSAREGIVSPTIIQDRRAPAVSTVVPQEEAAAETPAELPDRPPAQVPVAPRPGGRPSVVPSSQPSLSARPGGVEPAPRPMIPRQQVQTQAVQQPSVQRQAQPQQPAVPPVQRVVQREPAPRVEPPRQPVQPVERPQQRPANIVPPAERPPQVERRVEAPRQAEPQRPERPAPSSEATPQEVKEKKDKKGKRD